MHFSLKCQGGRVVSSPDFESGGPRVRILLEPGFSSEPFIIILPSSWYDLDNVERDVKHQIIIYFTWRMLKVKDLRTERFKI